RAGDVVVVAPPGGGLSLKRVAAAGPATVAMSRGELSVDGRPVPAPVPSQAGASDLPPTDLGPGELFVLGDDRRPLASRDSRDCGPLPAAAVRGRVVAAWRPGGPGTAPAQRTSERARATLGGEPPVETERGRVRLHRVEHELDVLPQVD